MYQFVTQEDKLTLHDCFVTTIKIGHHLSLYFEEGIDILDTHSLNTTGRHQMTGPAEVELQSYQLLHIVEVYDSKELPLDLDTLLSDKVEVLSFEFDTQTKIAKLLCDIDRRYSVEYTFSCEAAYYKWNELVADAWFQGWCSADEIDS